VTLVGRNKEGLIPFIEKKAGVKFERTGAPQPADMAKVAGEPALMPQCVEHHCCTIQIMYSVSVVHRTHCLSHSCTIHIMLCVS